MDSVIGRLGIACDEAGITSIEFCGGVDGEEASVKPQGEGKEEAGPACPKEEAIQTKLLREACRQLEEYFAGSRREFTVPLHPTGTPFFREVWEALTKIPYGSTASYREIADAVGRPKGCRAVGMANHRNPIPIMIPCHRVIGADRRLVGYGGGLEIKKALLMLEGITDWNES